MMKVLSLQEINLNGYSTLLIKDPIYYVLFAMLKFRSISTFC